MIPIFLASVTPYVGKNVLAVGLAEKFRREGKSVGYFKPIGPLSVRTDTGFADEDALFFKKILKLDDPIETLCPIVLDDETIAGLLRGSLKDTPARILSAYKAASKNKDVMIITGMGRLSAGLSFNYPMSRFARDAGAQVMVVERLHWPTEALDGLLDMRDTMGDSFAGVVFNRVAASTVNRIKLAVRPFLKGCAIDVLGVLSDDAVLNAVPVGEMVEALGGQVLCGGDKLDVLAENFSIGAMNVDSALKFFQRVPRKAVIVGGDRSDIQLAALETSTRCLILTGDLHPNERILTRADEAGVPVILTPMETAVAAEACERLHRRLSLHNEHKIGRACDLVEKGLDWAILRKKLGMK